jgi:hypothetical protein
MQGPEIKCRTILQVVNRCFQILQKADIAWRRDADLIITPHVTSVAWDGFNSGLDMSQQSEKATEAALPEIRKWFSPAGVPASALQPVPANQLAS